MKDMCGYGGQCTLLPPGLKKNRVNKKRDMGCLPVMKENSMGLVAQR